MYEPLFAFLRQIGPLPEGYEAAFSKVISIQEFNQNELLVQEGSLNYKLFFILKGIVRGYYIDQNGKEHTDWFLKENQLIAPAESYYFKYPCLDSIQALEYCKVLTFTFADLEQLYLQFPKTEKIGRLVSMQYSIYWRKRFKEFRQTSVEDRYKELLKNFPEIVQRVQAQYIASYLNTTRFHFSRIRGRR